MTDNIIIVGTGTCARNFYEKTKGMYKVCFFVDLDDSELHTLFEIPVISLENLKENDINKDIVICNDSYYEVGNRLRECNIFNFYVFTKGFLFHTDLCETMQPCELGKYEYYKKSGKEKVVLYISQNPSEQICDIAKQIKREGYTVILLYTDSQYGISYIREKEIFDTIVEVSTMNSVLDFIKNSEIDLIHSDAGSDILSNIARIAQRPIVTMNSDAVEKNAQMQIEDIVLATMTMEQSDGFVPNESVNSTDLGKNLALFYTRVVENYCREGKVSYEI